jgi:hypothetical protein
LENLQTKEWKKYQSLYHQIKSGILYGAGIYGRFDGSVNYNIETLVHTLYELARNEEHPIYPFIGTWNARLLRLAGPDFQEVREFRQYIERCLQAWVRPDDASAGDYYVGLRDLQISLEHPLRVFSLNYDQCVETLGGSGFTIEGGFGPKQRGTWEWKRFGEEAMKTEPAQLYLYKLHGSINWKRDDHGDLIQNNYAGDTLEIIFGREFKLEALDPYLLYVSEFRRLTIEARLVVVIGYSFSDDHINKMLRQACKLDRQKRLLVVDYCRNDEAASLVLKSIQERVGVEEARVTLLRKGAKSFLTDPDLYDIVRKSLPVGEKDAF